MKCIQCEKTLVGRQTKFCSTICRDRERRRLRKQSGYYQTVKFLTENKIRSRKYRNRMKQKIVEHLGGECSMCGYNTYLEALELHHVDPSKKDYESTKMYGRSWLNTLEEIDKCILLCANCHRELHAKEKDTL